MTDVWAPWRHRARASQQRHAVSTKARPSLSWIEVKDALPQTSASFFKSLLPLPAHHQDTLPPAARLELPASPRPCEELPRGARWGSDPMGPPGRVRAARLRPLPIPSPTVTAGTGLRPFKHIICARMAVKALRHHRTDRLRHTHTHETAEHCLQLCASIIR